MPRSMLAATLFLLAVTPALAADGFAGFEKQSAAGRAYAYSRASVAPDGSAAERFELRPGDCPVETGDCRDDRERIEFAESLPATPPGRDVWYHFSVFVPADWPHTAPLDTKLGQIHQRGGGKPPVLFRLTDGQYLFELSDPRVRQTDPMNPRKPLLNILLRPTWEMKGEWTNVMINARWSRGVDGFVKVWINGEQKVDLTGANIDLGDPVIFKYGIYRSFVSRYKGRSSPTLVAWYRNVKRGPTRQDVEPR